MKQFIAGVLATLSMVALVNYAKEHPTCDGIITYTEEDYYLVELSNGQMLGFDSEKNYHEYDRVEVCIDTKGTDTLNDDVIKSVHLI